MADETNSTTPTDATVAFTPATDSDVAFKPSDTLEAAATDETLAGKRSAKDTIKQEAAKLQTQAADKARSFAGDGKAKATGALGEFARMMTDAAGTVDERLGSQYGNYARSAAGYVSGFADTLDKKDVDDLVADAREFVRNSPMVAIGTAAALGFVIARVVKAGIDGVADASENTPPRV
ncbi:hypothetical protein [Sphingomonas japonica]|uniref:Membrane-anchored ribosome-binding protein, inhibits growth in stationary phase, ElaB/YqjD/DUF883 family n=1 Tax=Sphingomonas japonica TaxID=511662 RepID=A0ABX0U653_9SPHN|nr:hypothetical protein [Sphingomonas japonica]NIJ24881.1 hypothetical protein [Sphingomonas japonica]